MNTLLSIILGLGLGFVIGWLVRRPHRTDSRLEEELRRQAENLKTELERSHTARLAAESARSAADASLQAAVAQARTLEEQGRTAERRAGQELTAAKAELAAALVELKALGARCEATVTALAVAEASLSAANQRHTEHQRMHGEQMQVLKAGHEKALVDLREAFTALSAEALKQSQPEFLRLANETLAKFNEGAKGDLAQRQEAIATLVKPLEEQLKTYQQRLAQSETTQAATLGEVTKHLTALAQQSVTLSTETHHLRRVLSSGQARGRWGEETLRRVVEAAGMSTHCDFTEQPQSDEGKPDLIVKLPGDRLIVIDAKVPDLDFLNALGAADEMKRRELLRLHADKLRGTIKALADRDYPNQFPNSLDYVVLFLPAESLFSAALEGDSDLLIWAAQRRIMLATPATLIGLLRCVSVSWLQHEQTVNAKEIATAAGELFTRVATFTRHFDSIRSGLERATNAYNEAVGSFDRSVRPSGERLLKLGTDSGGKVLAEPEIIAEVLRPLPSIKAA